MDEEYQLGCLNWEGESAVKDLERVDNGLLEDMELEKRLLEEEPDGDRTWLAVGVRCGQRR